MIFRTLQRFSSDILGVPKKYIEAMHFKLAKQPEERYKDLRTFTNTVQDRLTHEEIPVFVRELQNLISKLESQSQNYIKSYLFKLFNEMQILDLIPLAMKVNLQELHEGLFYDEFENLAQEMRSKAKNALIKRKLVDSIPEQKCLTDFIKYERQFTIKEAVTKQQQVSHTLNYLDSDLMQCFKPEENADEPIAVQDEMQQIEKYKQQRLLKKIKKQSAQQQLSQLPTMKTQKYSPNAQTTPLELVQLGSQNTITTNQVCCYGLPYSLNDSIKEKFINQVEKYFGTVETIRYFEYSQFKTTKVTEERVQSEVNLEESDTFKSYLSTNRLLDRLKKNKNKQLFKTYALITFKEKSSKQTALKDDFRVFGFKFQDLLIKIDDADHKKVLFINNLAKEYNVKDLTKFLESTLEIKLTQSDNRVEIQHNVVCLVLSNFQESLRVYEKLNNLKYCKYLVKLFHYPDSLRFIKDRLLEQVSLGNLIKQIESKHVEIKNQLVQDWVVDNDIKDDIDITLDELETPSRNQMQSIDGLDYKTSSDDEHEMLDMMWGEEYFH